jgi:hypothetical protein
MWQFGSAAIDASRGIKALGTTLSAGRQPALKVVPNAQCPNAFNEKGPWKGPS